MRPSASLRYGLARLRLLANPLALIPLSVVVLVVVLLVEYGKDPSASQWQDADEVSELTPDQQAQAAEAEFDTLRQLLNGSPSPDLEADTSADSDNQDSLGATDNDILSDSDDPFAEYLDQYRFGNGTLPTSGRNTGSSLPSGTPVTLSPTRRSALGTSAVSGESALSVAIGRLQGEPEAAVESESSSGSSSESSGTPNTDTAVVELPNLPNQSGIVPGSLPGSDTTFIRTTPGMSPPPGTTGYTSPASLDLSIYNDTLNRSASPLPAAATSPLNLEQRSPGSSNNVLPTPGSITLPSAPTVPEPATADSDFQDEQRSAYESFWD